LIDRKSDYWSLQLIFAEELRSVFMRNRVIATGVSVKHVRVDAPDLTKHWTVQTRVSFPKNQPQRRCYKYLCDQMRASPDRRPKRKDEFFFDDCRKPFGVSFKDFDECWREAIKATGANWHRGGRPPKKL
jgi:hypothetical protein